MTTELFALVVGLVALVVAVFVAMRKGTPVSVAGVAANITGIEQAVGAARELVLAAEQLYKTGRITKDERFKWVLGRLRVALPDLDEDTLAGSIEAGVSWLRLLQNKSQVVEIPQGAPVLYKTGDKPR